MSVPNVLEATRDWLAELQSAEVDGIITGDSTTLFDLDRRANEAKKELEQIEALCQELEGRIERQFDDFQSLPYRLAAVFIHRGTASFGHYWIYIYDFSRRIWRKYNDGYVTEVQDEGEIFEQDPPPPPPPLPAPAIGSAPAPQSQSQSQQSSTQNGCNQTTQSYPQNPYYHPPTPYYLVYVKDELKEQLIDPICRRVVENQNHHDQQAILNHDDMGQRRDIDGDTMISQGRDGEDNENGEQERNGNEAEGVVQVMEMQERRDGKKIPGQGVDIFWHQQEQQGVDGDDGDDNGRGKHYEDHNTAPWSQLGGGGRFNAQGW